MKMWRENAFRDFVKTFLRRLLDARDWRKSFYKATSMLLDSVCSILADPLN
jgi:hypothetical protein